MSPATASDLSRAPARDRGTDAGSVSTDGPSGAVVTAASFVALAVIYVVPVLLIGGLAGRSGISIRPDYDEGDAASDD